MSKYKDQILKLAENTALSNYEISQIVGCSLRTVRRYAGSYINRCRNKLLENSSLSVHKTVLLPDIHYPNYEEQILRCINQFIKEYEPDQLVYMGDQLALDSISKWNKNKPLLNERKRLIKEYEGFDKDILQVHERITKPDTKRVFMIGNHEQRIQWYVEENPELEGILNIERFLNLKERGYEVVPYNEVYRIGKLNVIHGYYWNKYHAAKTVEVFEGNVVYGHVHNPQMFAKMSPVDKKDYHIATSLPCICNRKPEYKNNSPNRWINGFGIVEHVPATGFFNLYVIIIPGSSFLWNGKIYDGSEIE